MRLLRVVVLAVVATGLLCCGKPSSPPDLITRATGGVGPQRMTEGTVVNLNDAPDASVSFYDAGSCCMVPVAIAVQGDENVAYATEFPSGHRVALTKANGVWVGQLCLWLSEPQTRYYFQLGYSLNDPADADAGAVDGGEFLFNYVNLAAPTAGEAAVGEVNVFTPGGVAACTDLDAGVHSRVFDAGVVSGDGG